MYVTGNIVFESLKILAIASSYFLLPAHCSSYKLSASSSSHLTLPASIFSYQDRVLSLRNHSQINISFCKFPLSFFFLNPNNTKVTNTQVFLNHSLCVLLYTLFSYNVEFKPASVLKPSQHSKLQKRRNSDDRRRSTPAIPIFLEAGNSSWWAWEQMAGWQPCWECPT